MTSIRLYRRGESRGKPVATLRLARAGAGIVLQSVTCDDPLLAGRITHLLRRPSIRVIRGTSSSDGLRTRGDSAGDEPYGTPTYWRAAIDRLERELAVDLAVADRDSFLAALPPSWTRLVLEPRGLEHDLARFAEWQQHAAPEALAREVVARGLREIEALPASEQRSRLYRVARALVREDWRPRVAARTDGRRDRAQLLAALDALSETDRADLLQYYRESEHGAHGRRLGVTSRDLRAKVHRILVALRAAASDPATK